MATGVPEVPLGGGPERPDAAVQRNWRSAARLSSVAERLADRAEAFLGAAGFDRGPWLAVAFAAGVAAWFLLSAPWQWIGAMAAGAFLALAAASIWRERKDWAGLRLAAVSLAIMFVAGICVVWLRSEMVGAQPLDRPRVERIEARVLDRIEQPAEGRVRIVLAYRDAEAAMARKVRVNVPLADDVPGLGEGAMVRLRARLMPPSPPMLPGGYDFARAAWFQGLSATGSLIGSIEIVEPAPAGGTLAGVQRRLAAHVRSSLGGSPGTIAAAFASGDRGAIAQADEDAMRDAGLTHLLAISGLHVSAVIAAAYVLAIKLLALWPWFALRVRLPLLAAAIGAAAGVAYTLLTGAQVPTVRSCIGALLVLIALALGREPLSLRMVAVAAICVLLLWPEALVGPSFQMSFAAVLAIVVLHTSAPVKAFLAPREEGWIAWFARRTAMLLVTGLVIEIALMPIVLFHFHRAGVYGALANMVAIPLVTFASMPLIALALALDTVGAGAPAWWLAGKSLDLLLAIAHFTAGQPGAVKLAPQMGLGTMALFIAGGLWLALWRGRARLLGLVPATIAAFLLIAATPAPDVLISSDGRHVGIAGEGDRLLILRDTRSAYTRDNLLELAGLEGEPVPIAQWPGARCSRDFCVLTIRRDGRRWTLLMARSRALVEERALAAACDRADIVVANRFLPQSCRPRWLKADRRLLERTGGLALHLDRPRMVSVAESQGQHGWWRGGDD
ncbi:ComEC/Rec2 family competence protein [Pelagerythrobacter marensis]|uniref:Putative membrane metal-binding protein n=1 Tax=Pelagerythrobacter marensis TaxID=543877 RepID=A0A0G3X9R3_9SPHN|nr:ComEC/Rec2 family competence protein [Pelagerythrobacter marensis]AKM07354.1 putative membrane metal-binding protein [Pelagerythrobacter marensis]